MLLLLASGRLAAQSVNYTVALGDAAQHLLHITVALPPGANQREVQLPVWNALYQIRDFSKNLEWIRARDSAQRSLPVRALDKSKWQVSGAAGGAEIEYEIVADLPGPFGAEFNGGHAFLNLAEVLIYAVDLRGVSASVQFTQIPAGWKIATALATDPAQPGTFIAPSYDALVDAPVEMGTFSEASFTQAAATYHVVVDAPSDAYKPSALESMAQKITAAAVDWMHDKPFDQYLFIYHFPERGGGGMEHAYSCAIDLPSARLTGDPLALEKVTAHEFFHLWNVKRIRPASLEPVDYTRENYTRALWFSEGVTSTAQEIILLRAGLMNEQQFLADLALEIHELQLRPAHLTQSVEDSSLDAWLEKYPEYREPARSISYYNKGELLGVMLDLALRQATDDRKSLRDLFQWMNVHYAQQHRFFPDSDGVREAAEAISGRSFEDFFNSYVKGVTELPYDQFFSAVGLEVEQRPSQVAVLGFDSVRNFGQLPVVVAVDPASDAARAGVEAGDTVLGLNGKMPAGELADAVRDLLPGNTVRLKLETPRGRREIKLKLGARDEQIVSVVPAANPSAQQLAWRAAWLNGEDSP